MKQIHFIFIIILLNTQVEGYRQQNKLIVFRIITKCILLFKLRVKVKDKSKSKSKKEKGKEVGNSNERIYRNDD